MRKKQTKKLAIKKLLISIIAAVKLAIKIRIGKISMWLAIRRANESSRLLWLEGKNVRRGAYHIVIIALPYKKYTGKRDEKGRKLYATEKRNALYYMNRVTFQTAKRKGWLPANMTLDQLRASSFYSTDNRRDYAQEQAARERATRKYVKMINDK